MDVATSPAVNDADQAIIQGATVAITTGFIAGDTLTFTNSGGITGSYNATTGVLTFTGNASFAQYQTVLDSVRFTNAGDNPTTTAPTLAHDLLHRHRRPDQQRSGDRHGHRHRHQRRAGQHDRRRGRHQRGRGRGRGHRPFGQRRRSSQRSPSLSSVGRGTLDPRHGTAGLAFSTGDGTGDATMTFSGTAAEINAALAGGLTYTPTPNVNGADTLTMTTDDGTAQDVDMVAISVAAVNDAPTVAGDGTEDAAPIVQDMPSPIGQSVASLFGGQYSDATDQVAGGSSADAFAGVAVTANGSSPRPGQWQYFNGAILGEYRRGLGRRGGAARRLARRSASTRRRASSAARRP